MKRKIHKRPRKLPLPSVSNLARVLRGVNAERGDFGEHGIDVRLQSLPGSGWQIHTGPSDYDQDHRGYWGASSVPGSRKRFNAIEVARDLIEQAEEMQATGDEDGENE